MSSDARQSSAATSLGNLNIALYLIYRPNGAEHLRNHGGVHRTLVSAADAAAAIVAANTLVADIDTRFNGFTAVQVANTASVGFQTALVQGNLVGAAHPGPRRGH